MVGTETFQPSSFSLSPAAVPWLRQRWFPKRLPFRDQKGVRNRQLQPIAASCSQLQVFFRKMPLSRAAPRPLSRVSPAIFAGHDAGNNDQGERTQQPLKQQCDHGSSLNRPAGPFAPGNLLLSAACAAANQPFALRYSMNEKSL